MNTEKEFNRIREMCARMVAKNEEVPPLLIYYSKFEGKNRIDVANIRLITELARAKGVQDTDRIDKNKVVSGFGNHLKNRGYELLGTIFIAEAYCMKLSKKKMDAKEITMSDLDKKVQVVVMSVRTPEGVDMHYSYEILYSINLHDNTSKRELKSTPMIEVKMENGKTVLSKENGKAHKDDNQLKNGGNPLIDAFWKGFKQTTT